MYNTTQRHSLLRYKGDWTGAPIVAAARCF